jgi:hypothetical protein
VNLIDRLKLWNLQHVVMDDQAANLIDRNFCLGRAKLDDKTLRVKVNLLEVMINCLSIPAISKRLSTPSLEVNLLNFSFMLSSMPPQPS